MIRYNGYDSQTILGDTQTLDDVERDRYKFPLHQPAEDNLGYNRVIHQSIIETQNLTDLFIGLSEI